MASTLLLIIFLIGGVVFLRAFRSYDGVLQFPFLMTCDLLFFLGPQLYYISNHVQVFEKYDPGALSLYLGVTLLFYLAAIAGYHSPVQRFKIPNFIFNENKMIIGLYGLILISIYGKVKLAGLSEELTASSQWTGLPVRYLFFASVGTLCIPLGIILFFKYRRSIILPALGMEVLSALSMIVFGGRRSPAAFLAIMVLTGLWFARRIKISRLAIVGGGIVFFMFVMNVGTYRHLVNTDSPDKWSKITSEVFDIKKTIKKFAKKEGSKSSSSYVDGLNGVLSVAAVSETLKFDYGVVLWNQVISRWVPGQLIGRGLKKSLMLDVNTCNKTLYDHYGYKLKAGTCMPGYAEIFGSFGFLGFIFMYLAGRLTRMVWEQSMAGNLVAQIAHFALAPMYLRFGGGGIWLLITGLGFWAIFLFPILWWAKEKKLDPHTIIAIDPVPAPGHSTK
ncbi:hypothetical protein P4B35_21820 [Pontiellaceae bacterium B12227]|nr:hypothetical protein [Pontiellaceae bacterium B12227]